MDKSAVLTEDEIHLLEMVFNGKFTNLASPSNDTEAMVLKGYVSKKPLVLLPMMPIRYDYELTVYGLILLREYRPQYS
ncbi:hypothetical protein [Methylotenera sp. G11]|uniref:hypothetical protein n=1 Tax=Methylotenera sp. G11 TaxID=1506585 RepID=UPI000646D4CC|nr:hypothetical protein [Methylotenera sp. G11]